MQGGEEGLVVRGRVEIDMRRPFRSVREAVALFGEKVLAGEVYGNKLKEMQTKGNNGQKQPSKIGAVTAELEETKETLQKAKQESNLMAHCLVTLKQELEQTKMELHQLKARETQMEEPEIEELKFVENTVKVETITTPENAEEYGRLEFQKKRSVKFASPILTKTIVTKDDSLEEVEQVMMPSSKKKIKKKPLVPLIGGLLFLKKNKKKVTKGSDES